VPDTKPADTVAYKTEVDPITGEISAYPPDFDPNKALALVKGSSDLVTRMMRDNILESSGKKKDETGKEVDVSGDYGIIPGTGNKPTLLKPGAEKLCAAFGLRPVFELMPDSVSNWDAPFFYFHYRCNLYRIATGELIATANASCNSREDKYGYRWVALDRLTFQQRRELDKLEVRPTRLTELAFAIDNAETTGQYGKPAAYWQMFQEAIDSGKAVKGTPRTSKNGKVMDTWEIDATTYRVPNPDIYSIVNTLDKMAQKRALIAAVLIGTAASRFFSQDLDDLPDFGMVA
jgi:hypothetical protein